MMGVENMRNIKKHQNIEKNTKNGNIGKKFSWKKLSVF